LESAEPVSLVVEIAADGRVPDDLDALTRGLLAELLDLPVEARIATAGKPPKSAKSGDAVTVGALVVAALPGALASLLAFLQSWLRRGDGKSMKIKWTNGRRSFAMDLPSTKFTREQLNELLTTLAAIESPEKLATRRKEP
jgi:hypothetical protein